MQLKYPVSDLINPNGIDVGNKFPLCMADINSKKERSFNMSRVCSTETKPEQELRSLLHKAGFRFRKNLKNLPGKPDIVLPKYKAIVFVHGCFWHGHTGCKKAKLPTTRTEFWTNKIADNITRDQKNIELLQQQGWRIAIIWECYLKNKLIRDQTSKNIVAWLRSNSLFLEIPVND